MPDADQAARSRSFATSPSSCSGAIGASRRGGRVDRGAAQPLALARRRAVGPADRAQRTAAAAALELRPEQVADVGDEERPHLPLAVVAGLVPGQVQPLLGARDGRVEEVALGAEVVAPAQAQPRRRGDLLALDVAEERLGARRRGKDALLQAADEEDPHAPCAQRERLGDGDEAGRRARADEDVEVVQQRGELVGRRRERAVGARERDELLERAARRREHGDVLLLGTGQHPRLAPPRRREQRPQLGREALGQRAAAAPLRRAHAIDRRQRPALLLPEDAGRVRAAGALLARPCLEAIGELGVLQEAGSAQVCDEVLGAAVGQRAAQQADEPAPERGVAERDAPVQRDRDAVGREDLRQQRGVLGGRAQHDGDLLRRDAPGDQPRRLGRHELELGALAAALQQGDRVAGGDRVGVEELGLLVLEEAALEVVQRRARGRRVVLGAGGEDLVLDALANEVEERRRAPGEGHPAGLVGQRQRHLGARRGERLDGVVLQRLQVVEAVEEDGRGAPRGRVLAQRVERGGLVERRVDATEAFEPAPVRGVQAADLVGVRAAAEVLPAQARSAWVRRWGVTRSASSSSTRRSSSRVNPRVRADAASACSGVAPTTVAAIRSRASFASGRPCTPPRRAHSSMSQPKRTTCAPNTTPSAASSAR